MATKQKEFKADAQEAFVLVDCAYGKCGDVVTLPTDDAEDGAKNGVLDLHPEAIKAAKAK